MNGVFRRSVPNAWTCTSGPAVALFLLASSACSKSSTLEVRPRASLSDSTGLAGLVLQIEGREVRASSFGPNESGIPEVMLSVPNQGRLRIGVQLTQSGVVVAEGTIGWELANEYEWGMDVFRQAADPISGCFGCRGSEAVLIDAAARGESEEALWFTWGGKPKGSDIVF